jgi:molecular chaperone GrpE (heat shock protein)
MDRIQQELEVMRRRLEVMQNDLKKFAVELSATSQVAIIAEIARTSLHIKDIEDELEDMQFKSIVNDYFKEDDR